MKLAHKYALDAILKENQDIKGIIVYAPAMEWNVPLLQRPQHLAFQMAAKGYLYFYCTDNRHFDKISGFEKITDRCYVTDQHDLIIQSELPFIYNLNSICPGKIDSDIFKRINENHITIYDYIDHIHEYISGSAAEFIYKRHKLINPDIITCTARVLVDEMLQRFPSNKVYYLPNAAEYEHFHIKKEGADLPEDIKHIVNKNKPIIGYFGALAKWIDYNLVNLLAEKRPDAEIILIGWNFDGSQKLLKERPNLHVLGARPYAILPKYAIWFDIAIIPFSDVDISSSTSPIKLYEYMALGKPIVTTDVFECKRYRSIMAAQDHNEFLLLVERAFKLKDDEDYLKLLDDEAKRNTWEARASELEKAIVLRQQRVDNMGYGSHYIKEPLVVHEPNDRQPLSSKSSEILEGEKVDRHSSKYNGPMVSIIIPTCDRPGFLKEALQSVLSQTYKNFEIIVINDGGRDISGDINSLENSGKIIYLRHEDRRGPSAARNTGLKQARGKYIAYLDDDDIYYPNHLETLVVFLESHNYKVAYTDSYQMFQTWITDRYVTTDKKITYSHDFDHQDFLISNYIHIINIVHRREILDEIGLFDEGLETHEDWDMCIRLSQKYDFYHIKAVTAEFRTRDDMSSATNIKRVDFLRTLRLIYKRYSHLVTDPNILEAQKRLEKSLAMEVEIRQLSSSLMEYECLHQYRFAKEFVKNKKVFVLGGGKGYGSFILSEDAESVTCIDKDERNIRYASSNYIKENLEFIKGSITDVPVKEEKTFDVIVCFEALEQAEEHDELMKEVKRLLKDDGIFIVSSSNKYVSPDQVAYQKPLPLKELSFGEFKSLLKENFKNTLIYGQKVFPSSNIFPLFKSSVTTRDYTIEKGDKAFLFVAPERKEARYLIAVSSDGHIKDITGDSYLVDISETLFKLKDGQIRNLGAAVREKDGHIGNLEAVIRDKDAHIGSLEAVVRDRDVHISNLENAVRGKDAHIGNLEAAIRERDVHISNLEAVIKDKDLRIIDLEAAIRERDVHTSNLEAVIKDKDLRIIDLEAAIREKDVDISNLEAVIRDKNTHTLNLQAVVREKDDYIHHIHSGHGWRLLTKYFKIRDKLLQEGSRRRRMAKFIWNSLNSLNKQNVRKSLFYIKRYGFSVFLRKATKKIKKGKEVAIDGVDYENPYDAWIKKNEPSEKELEVQRKTEFSYEPTISIIVPTFNTPEPFLREMIGSVLNQTYPKWELCIADGGSNHRVKEKLKEYAEEDKRIKVKFIEKNKGIAGNSNEALSLATGEFVGFLDHDDILAPFALFEVVKTINENPDAKFIYSDYALTNETKKVQQLAFCPDFCRFYYLSHPYLVHLILFRKNLIDEVGIFDEENFNEGVSHDVEFFLRIFSVVEDKDVIHIPKVLYFWRQYYKSAGHKFQTRVHKFTREAIERYLRSQKLDGWVEDGLTFNTFRIRTSIKNNPTVSIIIPTKDRWQLLDKCLESIEKYIDYDNYEIIIVKNNTGDKDAIQYLGSLPKKYTLVEYLQPFNFSAINNNALKFAKGDLLLFLNDDIEFKGEGSIRPMVELLQFREVGIVGAKLLYPNETIQHAGVVIGLKGPAEHTHKFMNAFMNQKLADPGYISSLNAIREYSAVTGACLMTKRTVLEEVRGFSEDFKVGFGDVDLCLKVRAKGYKILYTPYALAYHYENSSRKDNEALLYHPEDRKVFIEKWGELIAKGDPCYNPNLSLDSYIPVPKG